MTRHARLPLALLFLSFTACAAPPMPPASDATTDAAIPDPPDPPDPPGPSTFTLEVVRGDLEVVRGERVTLDVRIVRTGGFAEPVLVELAGLPDPLTTLARESRPGDAVTRLTILTDPDGEPIERSPFVVQATSLDGLRHVAPVHITVL